MSTEPFAISDAFKRVPLDSPDAFLVVTFRWRAGMGQFCLLIATLLKLVDIAINIVVQTPTITRRYLEQVQYEWEYGPDDGADDERLIEGEGHAEERRTPSST